MRIKLDDLRRVSGILFDHLERAGITEVEVDKDYYWSIPEEKLYSVYEEPSNLTVGQLSHDLDELAKINAGSKEPIAFALTWLASVLRFVGAKVIS